MTEDELEQLIKGLKATVSKIEAEFKERRARKVTRPKKKKTVTVPAHVGALA